MRHCAGSEGSVVATVGFVRHCGGAGKPRSLSGLADSLESEKAATENQLLRGRTEQVAS
jgi:hypothetical protein